MVLLSEAGLLKGERAAGRRTEWCGPCRLYPGPTELYISRYVHTSAPKVSLRPHAKKNENNMGAI